MSAPDLAWERGPEAPVLAAAGGAYLRRHAGSGRDKAVAMAGLLSDDETACTAHFCLEESVDTSQSPLPGRDGMLTAKTPVLQTPPRLAPGEIAVWVLSLTQPAATCRLLESLLSSDEKQRAARFRFDRDRRRYIVCRGALRRALGAYLCSTPEALTFSYGRRGKPALNGDEGGRLEFNVSHSADLGMLTFADYGGVGSDIEWTGRRVEFESIARRFFTEHEVRDLLAVTGEQRREGFFNCWTRKEAYIKAIGEGLACPLHRFSVTLRPCDPPAMRWIEGDQADRWRIRAFRPAPGYVAAVAARWDPAGVSFRRWDAPDGSWPEPSALCDEEMG